jgi:hypothetical protein
LKGLEARSRPSAGSETTITGILGSRVVISHFMGRQVGLWSDFKSGRKFWLGAARLFLFYAPFTRSICLYSSKSFRRKHEEAFYFQQTSSWSSELKTSPKIKIHQRDVNHLLTIKLADSTVWLASSFSQIKGLCGFPLIWGTGGQFLRSASLLGD